MKNLEIGDKFDTSKVTTMYAMFQGVGQCGELTNLDLGEKFDTSNVTNMSCMFSYCGFEAMTSFNLGNKFNTEKVTNMSYMFSCFGFKKLTSLNLGEKFDTSNVTNMYNMFYYCGGYELTTLDLGDKFNTSNVTDMNYMFERCGMGAMTTLDLGPAFTKIADTNTSMFSNTGKENSCTIYAPESIYKNKNAFKLNSTDTTETPEELQYTRGTINPIYKPEWEKTSSTTNTTDKTVAITVKGSAYKTQTIDSNVSINYASDVTSTLSAEDITVYINGEEASSVQVAIGTGTTSTNATTGKTEVTHVITLSNLEQAVRQAGIPFKEWSGNISIKIGGRREATSTYTANVLKDSYGNQNMMATDETGTWVDVKYEGTGTETANNTTSTTTMFADFIKPEFTYEFANTSIGNGNNGDTKIVKVVFDVTDKYFNNTTLSTDTLGNLITVKVDNEDVNANITKALAKKTISTETTTGNITYKTNGDIYYNGTKVGERYELTVTGLEQVDANGIGTGFSYSGPMTLTFGAGIVTDKSSNTNNATTITIGIDETDGNNASGDSGTAEIVDVVDPIWKIENIVRTDGTTPKVTMDLIATDKYYASNTLTASNVSSKIKVYIDGVLDGDTNGNGTIDTGETPTVSLSLSSATNLATAGTGVKYTLTLSGWQSDQFSGTTKIKILADTITDTSGNTSKEQELTIGHVDFVKPTIEKVSSTIDATAKTETIIFNIKDKYLDTTDVLQLSDLKIFVDEEDATSALQGSSTLTKLQDFTETVNGETSHVVGQQWKLVISGFEQNRTSISDSRKYKDWSGTIRLEVNAGAVKDIVKDTAGGNENAKTSIAGDFADFIKPEVVYQYTTSDIDYENKTFKMVFDVRDKYFANSTLTIENFEDLIAQIMVVGDGNIMQDVNVTKRITAVENVVQETAMNKTVSGTVQTGLTNQVIGKRYTVLLENLEQDAITAIGNEYLNYSGVITLAVPAEIATDLGPTGNGTNPNSNNATTITSGVNIPGGTGTGTVVDVVDPIWEQAGTATAQPVRRQASIIVKGTDKYIVNDTLTASDIQVAVNGVITGDVNGNGKIDGSEIAGDTNCNGVIDGNEQQIVVTVTQDTSVSLAYGKQYIVGVTGFVSDAYQVKLIFREGILTDQSGNTSKEQEFILYSCLRKTDTETQPTSGFLGSNLDWDGDGNPDSDLQRQYVEKVIFQSNLDGVNDTRWDVSAQEDGSIIAWYTTRTSNGKTLYTVYIGSYIIVNGNANSSNLFRYIGYDSECKVTGDTSATGDTAKPLIENLSLLHVDNVTNMDYMFNNFGYSTMKSLDLGSGFDTGATTTMKSMFTSCGYSNMTTLNLGTKFNTSNVTSMYYMFNMCGYKKLTSLDLSAGTDATNTTQFNTSKVTDMSYMFINCGLTAMTSLNLGNNFDAQNVTNMRYMFSFTGQKAMTSLSLGDKFDTRNVTNMYRMFLNCGYEKMTTLNLGDKFNTEKVTNMQKMFESCGYRMMTSLDLGDLFYTTSATDMYKMFYNCGYTAMTTLDLGPAFTQIPSGQITKQEADYGSWETDKATSYKAYDNMFTNTGKSSSCTIYSPESIYKSMNAFKLNSTDTTATPSGLQHTRGTINPIYKPEWEKVSSTLNKTTGTMQIVVKGLANKEFTNGSYAGEYLSDVTSLSSDFTVYIDGEKAESITKSITVGTPTTNETTGAKEIQTTITLTNFEEEIRQTGKSFKEWSGNVTIQFGKGTLIDVYGNKNLAEIDIDTSGTMERIEVADASAPLNANTANPTTEANMFADIVKPEFTYLYSESNIDYNAKTVKIVFSVVDKYFKSSSLALSDLTIKVDGVDITNVTSVTKTLTQSTENVTATVNGVENTVIGKTYTLLISELEQDAVATGKNYLDYSGVVTVAIASGKVEDNSGNTNNAKTLTVGINEDGTTGGTSEGVIADVVDPLWKVENINIDRTNNKLTADLIATDKYYDASNSSITTNDITVYVDEVEITTTTNVVKSLSEPVALYEDRDGDGTSETQYGEKYTLTLSSWEEAVRQTGKSYLEWSGTTKIKIAQGTKNADGTVISGIVDQSGNTNKEQEFTLGHVDFIKPEIVKVSSTKNDTAKTETIVFAVTDKYYDAEDSTNIVEASDITVYIDDERADNITKTLTKTPITETRSSGTVTIGHTYTLVLSDFEKARNSNNYEDWSGTVSIEVAENVVEDTSGNSNEETLMVGDYVDFINPDIKYTHQSADIDKTSKKYTMTFDITDKYYYEPTASEITAGQTNKLTLDDLTIQMQNGQKDSDGNAIIYNLKNEPVTISLNAVEQRVSGIKATNATTGAVETVSNHLIGYTYTLTISNLEQLERKAGLTTADYSGIITVAIAGGAVEDRGTGGDTTNANTNTATTLTSGVNIPGGDISSDSVAIDVVDPIWEKVSTSANAFNPANTATSTATITFIGTDTYFANSTLTSNDIKVFVNGTEVTSGITKTLSTATALQEERLVNGASATVQYGVQYTLTLSGWAQNANQVKIQIPAGKLTDASGNSNKVTEIIAFNVLKSTATETESISGFLGNTSIQRKDIASVVFEDSLPADTVPTANIWDASAQGDGSIKAWYTSTTKPYTIYIGSDNEIFANQNSSYLFSMIGYVEDYSNPTADVLVNLDKLNTTGVTNMNSMFASCGYTAMTSFTLPSSFDTSNVTTMERMFMNCGYSAMTSLSLGTGFDTSKVTNMGYMFRGTGYTAMTSLNLGNNFNTANVTSMNAMFQNCGYTAMTSLSLGSKFDTSSVGNMAYMFMGTGYTAMTNLNLGANFDTSAVTNMSFMFRSCGFTAMTSLDLGSKFDTSSVENMSEMFRSCGYTVMTTLKLGDKFDTRFVTNMYAMFDSCGWGALTSLDLGNLFDTTSVRDMRNMFSGCGKTAMTVLDLGPAFTYIPNKTLDSEGNPTTTSAHSDFMTNCGTSSLVIYAPESIYSNRNALKLW